MELRQLEAFVAVVRNKTFTAAAEKLSLTQPAVTRSVAALETELGTKLLDRLGRTVALTAAGEVLISYAETVLRAMAEGQRSVRDVGAGSRGHLSIAASATIASYVLPDVLYRFGSLYPDIQLRLSTGPSALVQGLVLANEVDFGIVMNDFEHPEVMSQAVSEYRLVAVFASSHSSPEATESLEP